MVEALLASEQVTAAAPAKMPRPAILLEGIAKRFGTGPTAVEALKGVDMVVYPGEVVGLIGSNGSGKSTLLKCLGAVIEPTAGRITLDGTVRRIYRIRDGRTEEIEGEGRGI